MSLISDSGLRRVSVHCDGVAADLALPAAVPVDALIPLIADILGHRPRATARYHLARAGENALDPLTTLEHNEIHDGTVLVLSNSVTPPAVAHPDDAAAAVAACLSATDPPRVERASAHPGRQAAVAAGIASAVATGLLAVPDASAASRVLLAAMSVAVTAAVALRLTGGTPVTLTAACGFAAVIAIAALASEITGAPTYIVGSITALISMVLLSAAGKLAIVLARLAPSPIDAPDAALNAKAIRAESLLLTLNSTLSSTAATGALLTVLTQAEPGAAHWPACAFGAAIGAQLLLRIRSSDGRTPSVYLGTGLATTTTSSAIAANGAGPHGWWPALAMAFLTAVFIYLGCHPTRRALPAVVRRGAELVECLTLVALPPLTFWVCGTFGAIRGLSLP